MSVKNSNTTSDYIEWNAAINLILKLYRDGDFRMSLLVDVVSSSVQEFPTPRNLLGLCC